MNILLDTWATAMWRACWQGGLVVLAVWTICRLLPSMPARFQCWLWRLALLKFMLVLVVPWFFNVPLLPAQRAPEVIEVPVVHPAIEISHEELTPTATTPMSVPPTPSPPIPILPAVFFLAWALGVGWSFIRLVTSWQHAKQLRRKGHVVDDPSLAEEATIQCRLFGFRSCPKLLEVDGGGSPMLVGVLSPVILLPATTLDRLDGPERRLVLGHELAHVKRGDLLWTMVVAVVRAVFFFHPLVWLGQRRVTLLQEIAADELAISRQKHDPVGYGKLLVSAVGKFGPARLFPRMSVETVGSMQTLKRRLVAMTLIGRTSRRIVVVSGILLAATALLGILPWRLVAAEPEHSTEQQRVGDIKAVPHANPAIRPFTPHETDRVISIEVLEKKKGQPIAGIPCTTTVFVVGQDFEVHGHNDEMRVVAMVHSLADKNPIQHVIEARLIRGAEGKNPATLIFPKLTVTDDRPGSVVVKEADGSELGMEVDVRSFQKRATEEPQPPDSGYSNPGRPVDKAMVSIGFGLSDDSLVLYGSQVTDAGLANLERLVQVERLTLFDTPVTDAGLDHLKGLTRLKTLELARTEITGAGLDHLKGLSHLELLRLRGSKITDAGLAHLRGLPQLQNCS